MKIEHKPLQYVDPNYDVHQAVSIYARDGVEFGDPDDGPTRVTLLYFPKETEAELFRGNVPGAIKVVWDVKHSSHPDHARFEEKVVVQEKNHTPKPEQVLGLATKHEATGFLIKPGGFYLKEGEEVPAQKIDAPKAEAPAEEQPKPEEAPLTPVAELASIKLAVPLDGTYLGVDLHFPASPLQDVHFYKEKAFADYMAEHKIAKREDLTFEDKSAIMAMPDDFEADVAAADKWLKDHAMPGKLDDSIAAFREKQKSAQTQMAGQQSQTIQ